MVYYNNIDSGVATGQSVDGGITVTLSAGAFVAGVVAGTYLRVKSGPQAGFQARVAVRNSNVNLTMDPGIAGNLTNVDWVVINLVQAAAINSQTDRAAKGQSLALAGPRTAKLSPSLREQWVAARPATLAFGAPPLTISLLWLTPTTVKATFSVPVKDNAALRDFTKYIFTPQAPITDVRAGLTCYAVVPEAVAKPTYVICTTDEQTGGQLYNLTILNVEAA